MVNTYKNVDKHTNLPYRFAAAVPLEVGRSGRSDAVAEARRGPTGTGNRGVV